MNTKSSASNSATLLSQKILCDSLYNDLSQFTQYDGKINPDIYVTNYLYFSSFFASERIKLSVGGDRPTNPNLFITVVANSGKGKSYVNRFFYKTITDIQREEFDRDKEINDFATACRYFADHNPDSSDEVKQGFVYSYNKSRSTSFDSFCTKKIPAHVFTVTDFSPEALAVKFNNSRNNTLLLNADEFEELQNNIGRTKTVENTFTFLTSYFDEKTELITRKTSEDIFVSNARLCVLANTVCDTFDKLKASNFFSSGLGFRHLFYIDNSSDVSDPAVIKQSLNPVSYYEVYQSKIDVVLRQFFYQKVYLPKDTPVIMTINTEASLQAYNECLQKLWGIHIKDNDSLRNTQKETFKSRLTTMFNKCILNTFLMNFSYEYIYLKAGQTVNYPFENRELQPEDIMRGFYVYDYYLQQMTGIFAVDEVSDLTEAEQRIMSLLEVDKSYSSVDVVRLAEDAGITKQTVYRMMKKDSKQFKVFSNSITGTKKITRNF